MQEGDVLFLTTELDHFGHAALRQRRVANGAESGRQDFGNSRIIGG